jgi:hypothetical protein
MTYEMLAWQTARFTELALEPAEVKAHYVVPVRPEQVVDIALDGIQRSTRYPGGIALRFARGSATATTSRPTRRTPWRWSRRCSRADRLVRGLDVVAVRIADEGAVGPVLRASAGGRAAVALRPLGPARRSRPPESLSAANARRRPVVGTSVALSSESEGVSSSGRQNSAVPSFS